MPTHAGATLVSSSFGSLLTLTHPVLRYSFYEITFAGPLDDEQRNADYALCLFARGPNLKHVMFSFTNVILFRLSIKCRLACAVNDRVFFLIYIYINTCAVRLSEAFLCLVATCCWGESVWAPVYVYSAVLLAEYRPRQLASADAPSLGEGEPIFQRDMGVLHHEPWLTFARLV